MVNVNRQRLHHRTVNNGHSDSLNPVLPTTSVSPPTSNDKARRNLRRIIGGNGGLLSRQSILILLFGTLLGYAVLPIFLIESGPLSGTKKSKNFWAETDDRKLTGDDIMSRLIENKKLLSTQSLPTDRTPLTMETAVLSDQRRKKILVTGGAGFVGSHLVDKLMMEGHEVTVVDNFFTGQKKNVAHWMHHPNFR